MLSNIIQKNHPFIFPFAGNIKSSKAEAAQLDLDYWHPPPLLKIPTGQSGVVRLISLILTMNSGTIADYPHIIFNIKYDGESSPSVSVPLVNLVGAFRPDKMLANTFATPLFGVRTPAGSVENQPFFAFDLKYPIPYTNGIEIYLTSTHPTTLFGYWCNLIYQNSLPYCSNRNLRFKAENLNATIIAPTAQSGTVVCNHTSGEKHHIIGTGTSFTQDMVGKFMVIGNTNDYFIKSVEDATHLTLVLGDNERTGVMWTSQSWALNTGHIALNLPAGKKGFLAAVMFSITSSSGGYIEGNPRIGVNQETETSLDFSGIEDFADGCFGFAFTETHSEIGGLVCRDAGTCLLSMYRLFYDNPINYSDGIFVKIPNVIDYSIDFETTAIYYEKT